MFELVLAIQLEFYAKYWNKSIFSQLIENEKNNNQTISITDSLWYIDPWTEASLVLFKILTISNKEEMKEIEMQDE